jgi:hypothetical protein
MKHSWGHAGHPRKSLAMACNSKSIQIKYTLRSSRKPRVDLFYGRRMLTNISYGTVNGQFIFHGTGNDQFFLMLCKLFLRI